MAIRENKTSTLKLPLITGTDDNGDNIIMNKTISGFDPDLSDDDMAAIGEKVGGLYKYGFENVLRVDSYVLKAAA
ncbi:DUF1659 domain-containing protein [Anaerovibrio sp.]|uniref:DUF1659 domain-containing protein n=1 Tax=Anaerovibrio sp. TaxID=1872532 RepID=UPI003F18C6F4